MRLLIAAALLATLALHESAQPQTTKTLRRPVVAATPGALTKVVADISCLTPLGTGVDMGAVVAGTRGCDVQAQRGA